jgi:predicted membrane channel-forming protein YqfA (hemolysin III family)
MADLQNGIGMTVPGIILVIAAIGLWIGMFMVKDKNLPVVMFFIGLICLGIGAPLLSYGVKALQKKE